VIRIAFVNALALDSLGHALGVAIVHNSCLIDFAPNLLPVLEFAWLYLITGEVPFVKTQEFGLRHVPELFTLHFGDIFLDPGCDVSRGGFPVHSVANHFADDLPQGGPVLEPERIGLAQRLPHSGIAVRRALVSPDEYIAQEIDLVSS
jgi:hypothetical protein